MAITKLTSSKKAVLFITDEGIVYSASASMMKRLVYGGLTNPNFLLLTKMPFNVPSDKFPPSPEYHPVGITSDTVVPDGLRSQGILAQQKPFEDKKPW